MEPGIRGLLLSVWAGGDGDTGESRGNRYEENQNREVDLGRSLITTDPFQKIECRRERPPHIVHQSHS